MNIVESRIVTVSIFDAIASSSIEIVGYVLRFP